MQGKWQLIPIAQGKSLGEFKGIKGEEFANNEGKIEIQGSQGQANLQRILVWSLLGKWSEDQRILSAFGNILPGIRSRTSVRERGAAESSELMCGWHSADVQTPVCG